MLPQYHDSPPIALAGAIAVTAASSSAARPPSFPGAARRHLNLEPGSYGPAHGRHWTDMSEMPPVEHRSVAIRSVGAVTVEAVCTCQSWASGMRMWNDEIDCVTTVRDHGHLVVRYAPKVLRGSGKEVWLFDLDAYDQVATFPSGDDLNMIPWVEGQLGRGGSASRVDQVVS